MKQFIITIMSLACLGQSSSLFAQENQKVRFDRASEGIKVLVLELSSSSEIISRNAGETISIDSELHIKGSVTGWSFPSERPTFELESRIEGDTLFLTSPDRHSPGIIGISTYSEKIKNRVFCPSDVEVIISDSESLELNGGFDKLTVTECEEIDLNVLSKTKLAELQIKCQSLVIDGIARTEEYSLFGTGEQVLLLHAESVTISQIN